MPTATSDVVIDATGSAYEVLVAGPFTLNSLLLDSQDATLRIQSGGGLSIGSNAVIRNGLFALSGGLVSGGTLTFEPGAMQQFSSSGNNIFDGVTIIGDLNLSEQTSTIRLRNGTSVAGTISLTGASSRVGLEGTQTLAGTQFVAVGGSNKQITVEGNGTATLAADSSISGERLTIGGAFVIGGADRNFVNEGAISANVASTQGIQANNLNSFTNIGAINVANGGRFAATATVNDFANDGMISVVGAGSLAAILSDDWTNSGTISVTDGTLDFGGTTTTAGSGLAAGRITGHAASTLNLTGTLDNTGDSLSTDVFGGELVLAGGTIRGGTLNVVPGSGLVFTSSGANILDSVSVAGNLELSGASSTVRLRNGTSVSGQVLLSGSNSRLGLEGTQTVSGTEFVVTGGSNKQISVEGNGTITLASDTTISAERLSIGGAFAIGGSDRNIINEGTINANAASNTGIEVQGLNSFTNLGTIAVTNGGRFAVVSGVNSFANDGTLSVLGADSLAVLRNADWTNAGMIEVTDGRLELGGMYSIAGTGLADGRITGNAAATLALSGTLDNTGSAFTTADFGGNIRIEGATIVGGTITNLAGNTLAFNSSASNILDGVDVIGDLVLDENASTVRLRGGSSVSGVVSLTGNNARVGLDGGQTITDVDFVASGSSNKQITVEGNGVVTLAATTSVVGDRLSLGSAFAVGGGDRNLVTEGTIDSNVASATGIQVNGLNSYTNSGAVSVTNGGRFAVLSNVTASSNNGVIAATGDGSRIVIDSSSWSNSGTVTGAGAGSEVAILADAWSNAGSIAVTDGRLELGGGFTTDGSGLAAGRIVGSSAASLDISGALDNSNASFSTTDFAGTMRLAGGSITGGMLNNVAGDELRFSSSGNNILDGVQVNGELSLDDASATVRIRNGLSVSTGRVNLNGSGARVGFEGTQTIAGTDFVAIGSPNKQITVEGNGTVTFDAASSISGERLSIGSAFAIGGDDRNIVSQGQINANVASTSGISATSLNSLTNDGAINVTNGGRFQVSGSVGSFVNNGSMTVTGQDSRASVSASGWTNAGTISVMGSGALFELQSDWSNVGTISVTDGRVDLGGSFSNSGSGLGAGRITGNAGATMAINGVLDNTGDSFATDAFGGSIQLVGGRINGGVISIAAGNELGFSSSTNNILDAVQIIGDLSLDAASSTVRIFDGTSVSGQVRLTGSNARVGLQSSQTLSGYEFVATGSTNKQISIEGDGTVTLGADSSISAERLTIGSAFAIGGDDRNLVNEGRISANVANSSGILLSNFNAFSNVGTIEAVNGGRFSVLTQVTVTNLDENGMLVDGTYRVGAGSRLDLSGAIVTNAADIQLVGENAEFVGLSSLAQNDGALTIGGGASLGLDGGVSFGASSEFSVLVSGGGESPVAGLLSVGGEAALGGRLTLDFSSYSIAGLMMETTVRFIEADSFGGAFDSISIVGLNAEFVRFGGDQGAFTIVPSPGSVLVFGVSTSLLRCRRRRGASQA